MRLEAQQLLRVGATFGRDSVLQEESRAEDEYETVDQPEIEIEVG